MAPQPSLALSLKDLLSTAQGQASGSEKHEAHVINLLMS